MVFWGGTFYHGTIHYVIPWYTMVNCTMVKSTALKYRVLFMWYNMVHGTMVKVPPQNTMVYHGTTGCGKKCSPLKFFTVFLATAWKFNLKSYTFIC